MNYIISANDAKQADTIGASINETGKYIGTITRAEALVSARGTIGLGLSFKSDDGSTADYLDIYTHKANGDALRGAQTISAILACLRLRSISKGIITCEKWNTQDKKREKVQISGYPDLMGKRIGFLLRKELGTNDNTGLNMERMAIFAVFGPDTELTASEILDGKTHPEKLPRLLAALMAHPVRDNRKGATSTLAHSSSQPAAAGTGFDATDDDIPF